MKEKHFNLDEINSPLAPPIEEPTNSTSESSIKNLK